MSGLPPPVSDERGALLAFLAHQRLGLRTAAHGLTEQQARCAAAAGELTVLGLIKHAAHTERSWIDTMTGRSRPDAVPYDGTFRPGSAERIPDVLAFYALVATETEDAVAAEPDLGRPVPVPRVPWFPADVDAWSVRWVLMHLIEETARHAGHADIVRESVDGARAFPLVAAAKGWGPSTAVTPWRPRQTQR
ncbi:MAG TPA: DinB family protein [Nocardioidaceae bacterium]|nr:DinB family protein [Nocardioidaceae bacterium]